MLDVAPLYPVLCHAVQGAWEDALRVAKVYGGVQASKQVAYAWAISLGDEEGAALLKKLGLLDQAIDYAVESGAFAQVGRGIICIRGSIICVTVCYRNG